MPKEFWGGNAVLPEVQKAAAVVAPLPIASLPASVKPGTALPKKMDPRKRILLIGGGVVLFAAMATGAWYAWSLSQQEPVEVVVETKPVETKPVETKPVETKPVEVTPAKPVSGKDTDSDGITDGEEKLYGTDARNPDSDADSFLDGNEVFHRYDPLGPSPQTLLDTGTVAVFTSPDKAWTVYYPMKWKESSTESSTVFQTADSAQVTISVKEKTSATQTLAEWYEATIGKKISSDIKSLFTKNGYQELLSNDKLVAYVDTGTTVYVFTYDLKDETSIDYLTTFQMMINSLLLNN